MGVVDRFRNKKKMSDKAITEEKTVNTEERLPTEEVSVPEVNELFALFNYWQSGAGKNRSENLDKDKEVFKTRLWWQIKIHQVVYPRDRQCAEAFLNSLEREARELMAAVLERTKTEAKREGGEQQEEAELAPIDASVQVYVSEDSMSAYVCFFPPLFEGEDVKLIQVLEVLKKSGVTYGIEMEVIRRMVAGKAYLQIYNIARGTQPIDGKDGTITDYFPRENKVEYEEDEKGFVDFKNQNLFRRIKKNEIICGITLPEKGLDGHNIRGRVVACRRGKAVEIPRGRNTVLADEGTKLISVKDGYISFEHGEFRVEDKLLIKGDVNNTTGNLDFLGDVIVNGDVCNGFEIRATGNVKVYGMVEDAKITADGDIEIVKGMNGNKSGILEAKGSVRCSFLENCTVSAEGMVTAGSIVNCMVYSNDSVRVANGKGIIIGGTIMALRVVEAKRIGNQSNGENRIVLGYTKNRDSSMDELKKTLKETQKTLSQITKNVAYLRGLDELSESKRILLEQLVEQQWLYEKKEKEMNAGLKKLENEAVDYRECRVICDMIYPFTKISIAEANYSIKDAAAKCYIYYSLEDKDIVMGIG